MFGESRIQQVTIRIRNKEKQEIVSSELNVNECGQITLSQLSTKARQHLDASDDPLIFYYDYQQGIYVMFQDEDQAMIHLLSLAPQDSIQLRIQEKMSDELLANPNIKPESVRQKRSPQRDISQAFQLVQQWRYLYKNGTFNEKGQWEKINLDKSALIIGIPRKTLQDYYLLFRNGLSLDFDFSNFRRQKIGTLRSFVKQKRKGEKQKQKEKLSRRQQQKLLQIIRTKLFRSFEQQMQQQLFKVIESHSSDEDIIHQEYHAYQN